MPVAADANINASGSRSSLLSNMKSWITLVLLLGFLAHNACAEQSDAPDFIPINVVNVTMPDNGSVVYPDILVLLPRNFSAEQRAEFMEQLAVGIVGDIVESPDNALRTDTDADVTRGMDAALVEAARQIVSLKAPGANLTVVPETGNSTAHLIFAVLPTVEEEYIRKRRSLDRLAPLRRQKRTLKKHSKGGCMICQMLQPKQPIVINVYKQSGCGSGCQPQQHYQPPSCGQPQCGYHPQPRPPPVYHPPPQQTCDPCSHQQQPAYHQPYQQPSWSYSQSSAQSSSSSGSWGKKK